MSTRSNWSRSSYGRKSLFNGSMRYSSAGSFNRRKYYPRKRGMKANGTHAMKVTATYNVPVSFFSGGWFVVSSVIPCVWRRPDNDPTVNISCSWPANIANALAVW